MTEESFKFLFEELKPQPCLNPWALLPSAAAAGGNGPGGGGGGWWGEGSDGCFPLIIFFIPSSNGSFQTKKEYTSYLSHRKNPYGQMRTC